jgi:putative transcriptional regulator
MIVIRLKNVAEARGKKVRHLVDETGLAYNTVLALWRGSVGGVEMQTLDKLCRALQVQPGDLLVWQEGAENPASRQGEGAEKSG